MRRAAGELVDAGPSHLIPASSEDHAGACGGVCCLQPLLPPSPGITSLTIASTKSGQKGAIRASPQAVEGHPREFCEGTVSGRVQG